MAEAPPFFAYLEELRALQGKAKVSYPTGDRNYPVTERVRTLFNTDIAALLPGSPEPNAQLYPRNFLVTLEVTKGDETQSEVYLKYESTPGYPSGQNAWSYELNFVSNGKDYPIYIRRTTEPRQSPFVPLTRAMPFTGITEVRVTAQGKDYKNPPGIGISGGGGTGATAVAHVVAGKLVRIELTAHGFGYAAPVVTIGTLTGGSGATASAFVQSVGAILVSEETQPAPGDLAADFIVVTRIWKTLPGPVLTGQKLDARTGLIQQTTKQEVLAGTTLEVFPSGTVSASIDPVDVVQSIKETVTYVGSLISADGFTWRIIDSDWDDTIQGDIWEIEVEVPITAMGTAQEPEVGDIWVMPDPGPNQFIIDRKIKRLNSTTNLFTLTTVAQPVDWYEYPDQGEQFPAIFDFLLGGSWTVAHVSDLNRPGVVYNYLAHRTDSYTQTLIHSFTNGLPDLSIVPEVFHVRSPASGSRVFSIGANTIHPAFSVYDSKGPLEIFPASSPANYHPSDTLFRGADVRLWRGKMYHITTRFSREDGFSFPAAPGSTTPPGVPGPIGVRAIYLAESPDGGFNQPSSKTRLVYDGEPGDTFTTCGTADGAAVVENALIGNYGPVRGDARFNLIESIYIASTGSSFDPRVKATGSKGQYRFDFTDNPSPGEFWRMQATDAIYSPTPFGYTFVAAVTAAGHVLIGTDVAATRANLIAAINLNPDPLLVGIKYGTGTLPNPFFTDAESPAVAHATIASRLLLTGHVANAHAGVTYLSTGAADGTLTVISAPTTGADVVVAPFDSVTTHYNRSNLKNPEFTLNVPPGLADAECEEIDFEVVDRDVTIHYRMQAEVTIKYQTWNPAGAGSYNTAVTLPLVTGDTQAEVNVGLTRKIRFLISNSSTTDAKRADLHIRYPNPNF